MADLGNLFFNMRIKDMTNADFDAILNNIETKLKNKGVSVKVVADTSELLKDMRQKLSGKSVNVSINPSVSTKAKIEVNKTILEQSIREGLKDKTFNAKVNMVINKADVQKAIRDAFAKRGLNYESTPSDVRSQRILEIQQRMANANALAQQRLTNERNRGIRASEMYYNATSRSNNALSDQSKLLGQFGNQIQSVYSIYTIERFARSVIEIGGEFQKQRIALNAMLNDAARADTMFSKIKELAIESPYNFRDLMGFTKQVAAFGIPYEEMYETTKRLADISAGLGVDMGRIVLAFGQVRSAAVLRGQELRQFTEAGIPLVDELAKKFTELEGRVVSAGEVFEKISKREVSFDMVKDIMWKMTNEGGRFYNMQENLTESLAGKLAKLKDAWELMLGEIAEGNSDELGGLLDMLTSLTEKWEGILNVIKPLMVAYGVYKATVLSLIPIKSAMIALNLADATSMTRCTIAANKMLVAFRSLRTLGKAGIAGLVLGAITAINYAIDNATESANKLKNELDEIKTSSEMAADGSISKYKLLVNQLKQVKDKYGETAEQTKEYADIVKQMNSSYGQYLGNLFSEAEAYGNIEASVKRVTAAIRERHENERYQKGVTTIDDDYSEKINSAKKKLSKKIGTTYGLNDKDSKKFAEEIVTLIENNTSFDDATKAVARMFNKPYAIFGSKMVDGKRVDINAIELEIGQYMNIVKEMNEAHAEFLSGFNSKPLQKLLDEIDKEFEDRYKSAENNVEKTRQLDIEKTQRYMELYEKHGLQGMDYYSQLEQKLAALKRWGDSWVKIADDAKKKVLANNADGEKNFLNSIIPLPEDVQKGALSPYLDKLAEKWKVITEELKKYESYKNKSFTDNDKRALAKAKDEKLYIEEFLKALGLSTNIFDSKKTKGGEKDLILEQIKERLNVLKSAYSEYKKWSELVGDKEASNRILKSGLFNILGDEDIPKTLDDYKEKVEGIKKDLTDAINKTSSKERRDTLRNILKQILDTNYDITKDIHLAEINDMREYLKEYGSLEQKKLAITEEYEDKINKARTAGAALSLQKERDKKLASITYEHLSDGIDWKTLFSGVSSLASDMASPIIEQLENFTKTDEYKKADSQTKKDIASLIQELRKYTGSDHSATWEKLATSIKSFEEASKIYKSAVEKEKEAKYSLDRAKKRLDNGEISQKEYDDVRKSFNEAGTAAQKAKENMQHFASEVNTTSEAIANFTSSLSATLNKAKAWENIEGFSEFKNSIAGIDGLKGTLDSIIPSLQGKPASAAKDLSKAIGDGMISANKGIQQIFESGLGKMVGIIAQIPKLIMTVVSAVKNFVSGIINSFAELFNLRWIDDLVNSILQAIGNLINSIFDLPENIYKVFESIVVNGIGGLVDTFWGRVGNIMSFGLLSSEGPSQWFKNSNAEKVAAIQERLSESNKILATAIDDLRDEISKTSGTKAINATKQALDYQQQRNQGLLGIAKAQAGYHDAHKSWNHYMGWSKEDIAWIQQNVNKDFTGTNSLWSLSPEEMKKLRSNVEIWTKMMNAGKGGYGKRVTELLDKYIEEAGKVDEITDELRQSLTQTSFDSLRDSFLDSLMDMDKSAADFADDFSKYMMKAMLNAKISDFLDDDLNNFYKKWGEYAKSDNEIDTKKELPDLKKDWEDIVNKGLAFRDQIAGITGFDKIGDKGGLSAGITSITEQTADLLASYVNAIRADVSIMRSFKEKFFGSDFPQLNAIAQAQLTHLNTIAVNTGKNVELVNEIYTLLRMNIRGANKFHI